MAIFLFGVPDGNRTHVTAATELRSTIELRAPSKLKVIKFQVIKLGTKKLSHRIVKSLQKC